MPSDTLSETVKVVYEGAYWCVYLCDHMPAMFIEHREADIYASGARYALQLVEREQDAD